LDIELSELPTFFLAYLADPSSSSNIHSAVKQRFFAGEPAVVEGMAQFGLYTVEAKVRRGDWLCSCRHLSTATCRARNAPQTDLLLISLKLAIEQRDWEQLGDLMEKNFALRRELYGDEVIGASMLKMVTIGTKHDAAVKFPGSGGAVVGLLRPRSKSSIIQVKQDYEDGGFVFTQIQPAWTRWDCGSEED